MRLPCRCTHQSGPKAIGLPELEAHVVGSPGEPCWAGVLAPESEYVALFIVRRRRTAPQAQQHVMKALALGFDLVLALAVGAVGVEMQRLVDDRQVALVVNE